MRLELRVQNIAGNQHLNHINKAPCLPAFHNDFTEAQLCVYPGTHRSTDTAPAARLYLLGNNLCTGRKETCPQQCEWQASRTGLFPNLMWGEKESRKLPPWPSSPSLLPDPCCRTASKEHLGPTEVKDSTCPDMCSPWLSFFSPTADPYQPWCWRGFQKKGQHPGIFLALSSVYSEYFTLGEVSCVSWVQTAYSVEVLSTNQNAGFGF